eukprot:CAMPEP_0196576918 /NCGR_PEP_ID=MMETSP1081-20130531/6074_1 /TAXON_ID=36882 /ORGANISM="Pyramimonas amylifera, Strain CCMP720" /LENGTH=439 /DNA_ID=CAMNT_0041895661 /DNA_START=95 /DNA_END=1411 /DNA_ORIENTATION=+
MIEARSSRFIDNSLETKENENNDAEFTLRTPPTKISSVQNATVARVARLASSSSISATNEVISTFSSASFRASWSQLVSRKVADFSAVDILASIRKEILAVEVVHAFPSTSHNPKIQAFLSDDWNLTVAKQNRFYPNIRTLYFGCLQSLDMDSRLVTAFWDAENLQETDLMGFPKFTERENINRLNRSFPFPASWEEAYNRPVYSASNLQRRSLPLSTIFGDIQVVFRRSYINSMSIINPTDAGCKTVACRNISFPFRIRYNCSAWPYLTSALGVPDAIDHLLLPNVRSFGPDLASFNLSFEDALARQYARLLDDDASTFDLALDPKSNKNTLIDQMAKMFYEFAIAGNILLDEPSVKLIVASYSDLFGSSTGREVQQWAMENGWMLAWALSPKKNLVKSSTWRILDPDVASHLKGSLDLSVEELHSLEADKVIFYSRW